MQARGFCGFRGAQPHLIQTMMDVSAPSRPLMPIALREFWKYHDDATPYIGVKLLDWITFPALLHCHIQRSSMAPSC
jgi:hypothetical protein